MIAENNIGTGTGENIIKVARASSAASMMTAGIRVSEPNRQVCADCRGKGFDLQERGKRAARRCQRCRGKGNIEVGSTKR